jgi:predicted esterase
MDFESHRLIVPRSARYLTLGALDSGTDDVWILCHGYGQLASDLLRDAEALVRPRRLLVAPEALSRFYLADHEKVGASWMTREDRLAEMEDYVRYLDLVHDQLFDVVPRSEARLRVLGFSQGVATAARWAVRGQAALDELILWGSALPPELDSDEDLAPLRRLKLVLVRGNRDEFLTGPVWAEERSRLSRHGIAFDEMTFEGGHRLDDRTLLALSGGDPWKPRS